MRTVHRAGRIIGALTLALALSFGLGGCSTLRLGYASLPEVGYWWLDSQLDFTDAQTSRVRDDLARLQQWHRREELPRYAALLQGLERLAPGELGAAQACAVADEARQHLQRLAQQAEPALVATALTLSPAQVEHLAEHQARGNRQWRKDWLQPSPADRVERRVKLTTERLERFYGRLDAPQREVLRQQLARSSFDPQRVLAERERRQADLLQTLRRLQAPELPLDEARSVWRGFITRVQASPDTAWQRHSQQLLQENCALVATVHASTTAAQREAAATRLRGWQRDLAEIAAAR